MSGGSKKKGATPDGNDPVVKKTLIIITDLIWTINVFGCFELSVSKQGRCLFVFCFPQSSQPEQHTRSALVGNKKVLGGERTRILSKHWTEDRDVARATVLTLWENFLQQWRKHIWMRWDTVCERATIMKLFFNFGFAYLNSNRWSAFYVLFCSLVGVCRRAQMLVWHPSSVEGWQDRHGRLGGTLDSESVSFTGVGCVVLQDVEQIDCKRLWDGATSIFRSWWSWQEQTVTDE